MVRTILVVDDEASHRMMLGAHLKEEGFEIGEASDGQGAMDLVSQHFYDLILMDIRMPVMDGIEALKQIKKINPALPETLLESELFGHEKGAFTGAFFKKKGRFELADGGTLFLDEIGEMSPSTQTKILRVLQEREFEAVGGTKTIPVDVRIITATHKDLEAEVKEGRFREDLFYRLYVVPITIPPLRNRNEDIPLLVDHFLGIYSQKNNRSLKRVEPRVMDALVRYP